MPPDMNAPLKIVHVITGLQIGGAEIMLCRLLEAMDAGAFSCHVVCLGPRGPLAERVEKSGATLTCLGLGSIFSLAGGWWRLARYLRRLRPNAVHTWMYHADLLGGLAARFGGGRPPVAWALHHSHAAGAMKRSTQLIVHLLARLSHWIPQRIVSCSQASMESHQHLGYDSSKFDLIFNGADAGVFQPDPQARSQIRAELGISENIPLIGFVGRNVPVKDLPTFLKAAALVLKARPKTHFLLCGPQMEAPAIPNVHIMPFRPDVHRIYPALDLLALTSLSEACPMSLIEAMACGVPCTSTAVGDSAYIIHDANAIAPVGNAEAIARTWLDRLLANDHQKIQTSLAVRQRAQSLFSLETCVHRYQSLYRNLANQSQPVQSERQLLPT